MYSSNGGPLSQAGRWGHESRPERYGRLAILVHSKHSVYNGLWYVVKTVPGEGRKYLKALSSVSLSLSREGSCRVRCGCVSNRLLRFYRDGLMT